MNFQDFILIAEGKKKQLKSMLSYAWDLGQQESPTETVKRPVEVSSIEDLEKMQCRKNIMNYWEKKRKEAEKRKKKAIKALMKKP